MNDIFKIQEYSNRLNRDTARFEDLKKSVRKTEHKSFDQILREDISSEIQGIVSSAEIKVNRNIKDEIASDPYRKKLFNASVEFESMFVKLMLKEMKASVSKNKLIHGGYAEEIFEDMLTDEQAKSMSENNSIGLAEEIYSTLSRSLGDLKA
jgi:flagellar protein FlgJ